MNANGELSACILQKQAKPGKEARSYSVGHQLLLPPFFGCPLCSWQMKALLLSGHRPALQCLANAFSLVSEVLQGGLAESSCPFYSPQLPHGVNDTSLLLASLS